MADGNNEGGSGGEFTLTVLLRTLESNAGITIEDEEHHEFPGSASRTRPRRVIEHDFADIGETLCPRGDTRIDSCHTVGHAFPGCDRSSMVDERLTIPHS